MELYLRDYLMAEWRLDNPSVKQTLWLEASSDPNVYSTRCASSLGFGLVIQYRLEGGEPSATLTPAGSISGMACYANTAADAEIAATGDAMRHLREAIFHQ